MNKHKLPVIIIVIFVMGFFLGKIVYGQENEPVEEFVIEKRVVDFYVKGLQIRDFNLIKEICIPDAMLMSAGHDGNLRRTTLEKWSKRFDPQKPAFKKLDYCILKIDRTGLAAQVAVLFIIDSKKSVTDYLHMLKIQGTWKVVNIIDY